MKLKDSSLLQIFENLLFPMFPILSIILALIIGAILIFYMKINPLEAYKILLKGSLGNIYALSETIVRTIPILFTGLGYAIAFNGGLFNVGLEGQFYMGGLGATLGALFLPSLPSWLHLSIALLLSFIMGGALSVIPAFLKAWKGISEIISTIMFVYIGMYFVNFMVSGPIRENIYFPQSPPIPTNASLPSIISNTRLTMAFPLVLIFLFLYYLIFYRNSMGLKIRILGKNPTAAEYIGIDRKVMIIVIMFFSAGLAGLGGATEVLGVQRRLSEGFSPGYGWDGVTVGLLGQQHPLGMFFAAFLLGMLRNGGSVMQRQLGVPITIIYVIQAIMLVGVLISSYMNMNKKQKESFLKKR